MERSRVMRGVLSESEVAQLIAARDQSPQKSVKGHGGIDIHPNGAERHASIRRLGELAVGGPFEVGYAMFMDTPVALGLHADTGDGLQPAHTLVLVPLDSDPEPPPGTVLMRQHWLGPRSNFVAGETTGFGAGINQPISDYQDVVGKTDEPFDEAFRREYLWHLKPEWLRGMSHEQLAPWERGSAIVFRRSQIHCSAATRPGTIKRHLFLRLVPSDP